MSERTWVFLLFTKENGVCPSVSALLVHDGHTGIAVVLLVFHQIKPSVGHQFAIGIVPDLGGMAELVIDAVRCALSGGQADLALQYLNSAVRNSKSERIQAQIKLYEQWAALSKAETVEETQEAITYLKVYATLPSMDFVKKSVLLTLWYMTDSKEYASDLIKQFPESLEAGIVLGKVMVMPAPFWYFVPREKVAQNIETAPVKVKQADDADSVKMPEIKTPKSSENTEKYEVAKKLQLGLFRDKVNAQSYAEKVTKKGFKPYIQEEKRASGTIYYIVVVDENSQGTMGTELKTAGFESYPIF